MVNRAKSKTLNATPVNTSVTTVTAEVQFITDSSSLFLWSKSFIVALIVTSIEARKYVEKPKIEKDYCCYSYCYSCYCCSSNDKGFARCLRP